MAIDAIVDLETTGSSFQTGDRIIQIGCVLVEDKEIIGQYDFLVNPERPIPQVITDLTGISNMDVSASPTFSEIANSVYALLSGCRFVAHNVMFDYSFLAASFKEFTDLTLDMERIDTVQLAQICFPTIRKYRLNIICEELGIDLVKAHSANEDALATAKLYLKCQEKLTEIPFRTLRLLSYLSDALVYETKDIVEKIHKSRDNGPKKRWSGTIDYETDYYIDSSLRSKLVEPRSSTNGENEGKPFNPADLKANAETIPVRNPDDFKDLTDPKKLSALSTKLSYMISQPTRATVRFNKTDTKLGIISQMASQSTISVTYVSTDALSQRHLHHILRESLPEKHIATLKTPRHYLELSKLNHILAIQNTLSKREKLGLMAMLVWLTETNSGDLTECPRLWREQKLVSDVGCGYEDLGTKANTKNKSCFSIHLNESLNADIVIVTNHFLLEAISHDTLRPLLERLVITNYESFTASLRFHLSKPFSIVYYAHRFNHYLQQENLNQDLPYSISITLESCTNQLIYLQQFLAEDSFMLQKNWLSSKLYKCLKELKIMLNHLLKAIKTFQNSGSGLSYYKVLPLRQTVLKVLTLLEVITSHSLDAVIQVNEETKTIRCLPINLKPFIKTYLSQVGAKSLIIFETTPSEVEGFDHIDWFTENETELMTNQPDVIPQTSTPLLMVPVKSSTLSSDEKVSEIKNIIVHNNLKTVIYVQTKELLNSLYSSLLNERKDVYAQDISGPVKELFDFFGEKSKGILILLGDTMWLNPRMEVAVEQLIISKLPFSVPTSPSQVAAKMYYDARHRSSFYDYSLPLMLTSLNKMLNSFLMNDQVQLKIWLLDDRILTKRYGREIAKNIDPRLSIKPFHGFQK